MNKNNIYGKIDFAKSLATLNASGNAETAALSDKGKNYTILFYGSIFNLDEVHKELKSLGLATDASQSKSLLTLFVKIGSKALDVLNGMYTFAIYESTDHRLFMARDRVGSRSLLYTISGDTVTFASDYGTLFKKGNVKAILDKEGLTHIFLLGPAHSPTSGIFKGVDALAAGHYLEYSKSGKKLKQYWSLTTKDDFMPLSAAIDTTRDLITTCVHQTLPDNDPPAIFLSGGLDSSIVGQVAALKYNKKGLNLTTYSIDFEDSQKDFLQNSFQPTLDKDFIGTMVQKLGSEHHDVILSNLDLGKALQEAAIERGLPGMADVDSSLLLFCKQVSKTHTTALSGECADEIFGGYPWYHEPALRDHDGFPWSRSTDMRSKLLKNCDLEYAKEYVHSFYHDTIKDIEYAGNETESERRIRQLFVLNLNWFGATLLERKERMSVAANVNVRMPFTDHRLLQWAYNLPWAYKSVEGREKGVMRQAFKDILPNEIIGRKKSPFPKTYSPIYLDYVKSTLRTILDSNSAINQIVDKDYLLSLFELDPADVSVAPWYGQLMRLPQVFAFVIQLDAIIKEFNVSLE